MTGNRRSTSSRMRSRTFDNAKGTRPSRPCTRARARYRASPPQTTKRDPTGPPSGLTSQRPDTQSRSGPQRARLPSAKRLQSSLDVQARPLAKGACGERAQLQESSISPTHTMRDMSKAYTKDLYRMLWSCRRR